MSAELHIEDGWHGRLAAAELDTFDALMQSDRGLCRSWHDCRQTYQIKLVGSETIFLKRDTRSSLKDLSADLCRLRRPQPLCMVELAALRRVAELGVRVPEVIAYGQRRRAGLPWQAVLVMRRLPGVALHKFLRADPPAPARQAAMRAAGAVAGRLYGAGLSWPDLVPKHFFLEDDLAEGTTGVLDLARMRPTRLPRRTYIPRQVRRFCGALLADAGNEADQAAFLEALDKASG